MGKRVNLAELAVDDVDYGTTTASTADLQAVGPLADLDSTHRLVPIGSVALNPLNKRPAGEDDELEQLAETIREHGVIQPLVVCSSTAYLAEFPRERRSIADADWVVLIGNRRLRAARLAEMSDVSIVVNDDRVTSMYEVMLVENGQRRELPPLLEAEAMAEVLDTASISQRELARRIGKSAPYIGQRLALLKLVPELRRAFEKGELTVERAREFGELTEPEQRAIVAAGRPYRRISDNAVTGRPASRSIRVSSPAAAADSIRKSFSADELAELVRLLSEHLGLSESDGS
jgi:ParB family chromosome partitioning protein